MSIPRRRLFIAGAVVLVLVATAAVVWILRAADDDPGPMAAAVAMAPEDSQRLSWTDWSGVRKELDSDVSASSTAAEVEQFLADGFDADLTSTSALVTSASALQDSLGLSPASVDWELFAQSEAEALLLMGVPESFDLAGLEDRLADVGYTEPEAEGGAWRGDGDVDARLSGISPELTFISIDAERRVVAASDALGAAETWQDGQRGEDRDDGVSDVVGHVEGALTAAVYTGDHACVALAMTQAAQPDRTRAADLVAEAGEINPMRGFAIAELAGGDVRVAMAFESDDQARTNADTRARLAAGPAPGQGGDFAERFALGKVAADGTVVTMELEPLPGSYVLSDLSTGPVLFATC